LADERDAWTAFADFMRRAVDANTSSLAVRVGDEARTQSSATCAPSPARAAGPQST
jgi:hypothetical protein